MNYKITKQYLRGGETTFAECNELADAKIFVEAKMQNDASLNVKVTYRIVELGETIAEFKPGDERLNEQSSQGQGKSASFRPTPLNTAPRPPGSPQKWLYDEDEDETKK